MGDRAIANIKTSHGSLYVYTHWQGSEWPMIAANAIQKAKPRWDDETYATRIIVDQLIKENRDEETGAGIALVPQFEDEYNHDQPSVIIDLPLKKFIVQGHGESDQNKLFMELK